MAKITLIKTDAAIDKMITSIASRGSKLQHDTHRVLASILVADVVFQLNWQLMNLFDCRGHLRDEKGYAGI